VNHALGLIVEGTVAALLLVTIVCCVVLERRLRRFRADEQSLRTIIAELITATETAERAIAGLKMTVRECDQTLGERLRTAERFVAEIDRQLGAGEAVMRRLAQIATAAGRPALPAPTVSTQSTLAAAQALIERTRNRSGDLAA
jgi:hypothetical protein